MSVSKVESHILDGLSYYTGEIFLSTQKAIPYSVNKALDTDFREEAYKKSNSWLRPWLPSPMMISIQLQVCFHLPCCILCLQSLYVLSTFNKHQHFNVAQVTQFYLKLGSIKAYNNYYAPISSFSSENTYAFSAMCDICKLKPVKPVFWSTNTMRYLYSFLALFVLKLNNNIK